MAKGKKADTITVEAKKNLPAPKGSLHHYSCFLQILGMDVDHNSPSVMLVLDKGGKYIFNAGEGLQRLMREKKIKMQKVEHYLFTRVCSETMAGLPGMLLSTSTYSVDTSGILAGQEVCTIAGPRGLKAYVNAFKHYVNNQQTLKIQEMPPTRGAFCIHDCLVDNEFMVVIPVVISPTRKFQNPDMTAALLTNTGAVLGFAVDQAVDMAADLGTRGVGTSMIGEVVEIDAQPSGAKRVADCSSGLEGDVDALEPKRLRSNVENGYALDQGYGAESVVPEAMEPLVKSEGLVADPVPSTISSWSLPSDVTCYVCEMRGVPGKFDHAAAETLGVPKGPERGSLQRGQSVTLSTGRVVEPHEVMNPAAVPGPVVLVVDLPSLEHLETVCSLGDKGPFSKWIAEAETEAASSTPMLGRKHRVMMHLSPAHVVAAPAYQAWLSTLGEGWSHVVCNAGGHQTTTMRRATELQIKLNAMNPHLFPSLHPPSHIHTSASVVLPHASVTFRPEEENGKEDVCSLRPTVAEDNKSRNVLEYSAGSRVASVEKAEGGKEHQGEAQKRNGLVIARNGHKHHVLPFKTRGGDSRDVDADLQVEKVREAFMAENEEVVVMARAAADRPAPDVPPECLAGIGREELEVVFFGTVSSVPSKFRNVTSIYLDRFALGGLLLDCGEDTLGQMKRRYGAVDAEHRVKELSCVWVSHMHADHHGGLYRLLELRAQLLAEEAASSSLALLAASQPSRSSRSRSRGSAAVEPLLIIGPSRLFTVLAGYREVLHAPFHFLPNHCLVSDFNGRPPPPFVHNSYLAMLRKLELQTFQPVPVEHIPSSFGIKVAGETGWTLVFSGDSRPTQSLVEAARNATLLIHEATFEDEMQEEAIAKRHSTTSDAMRVASQAGAYRTILTHFSSRYPTMPNFDMSSRPDVAIAMDFMSVNLCDLPWLPGMVKPLDELFKRQEADWQMEDEPPGSGAEAAGGEKKEDDGSRSVAAVLSGAPLGVQARS
ncbi:hypothetical protein CEUSTIGMA_g13203.t1 [Chlamydomonas eustigma]|uniref:ribonuclease Z n=1 Tax=Chlamydomonas eustigma TaxID=1157962 RepID=A0A250XRV0_9CHLO|nr:hypothetical protein CEUSTIGMA_g13203.t1 [Chlamydomonas eustigma]|eukprot:GAX85788.1 hypothetical protein CEUSTIGMA_g13203.t1 [Chlamydomonas eustigma]